MGAKLRTTLAVLIVVMFVVGCSSQNMQTASTAQGPTALATGPVPHYTLAAGDSLGQRLFVQNPQPSAAVAQVD